MKLRIAAFAACSLLALGAAEAGIMKIVIDTRGPAFGGQVFGAGAYEAIVGRAFGELDPNDPHNAIITDIELAPRVNGKVQYVVSFQLLKPVDMARASGLMWHDVPNRGNRAGFPVDSRDAGDIQVNSGWQGENAGGVVHPASPDSPNPITPSTRDWVKVPIARNADGSPIRGRVMGRILNASGVSSSQIFVHSNVMPYKPLSLDTTQARMVYRLHETIDGKVTGETEVASADWAWASCSATNPFPGTPDPTQICVRGGFVPDRVYQVVFTTQDPPVLGIGFAAFRDIGSFFKNSLSAENPIAGKVNWVIGRGSSQSGNYLRAYLHLGFNEDEAGQQVQDGTWPIIAGRRVSLNTRFAMPDGVLKLYEPGSEGPQWWHKYPDQRRGLPPAGILDRCHGTGTCPKIIEHFGAAEVWGLKLGPEWVGTDAKMDIPLPKNVRRYYIASTDHGGGSGLMGTPTSVSNCPSVGYGRGTFVDNPMPHAQTVNAIRYHFRRWVMNDILPPDSVWPRKHQGNLVAPTKAAMGFPTIPGVPATAPTGLINPVLDYDFGPDWDYTDASGVTSIVPPIVKQVIPALVPKVDADGNELGGVPVVLREAPLGTYTGWNITAAGFHKDKICGYLGGFIPFAKTQAQRLASNDPRLSLQERYGNRNGYVEAVRRAAAKAVAAGFLLQTDADALILQAGTSTAFDGL
jgi:hypothetical protein